MSEAGRDTAWRWLVALAGQLAGWVVLAILAGLAFASLPLLRSPAALTALLSPVALAVIMGGRKTRSGALIGALIVVMLPSLLADIELFRKIAVVAAVLGVTESRVCQLHSQAVARLRARIVGEGGLKKKARRNG